MKKLKTPSTILRTFALALAITMSTHAYTQYYQILAISNSVQYLEEGNWLELTQSDSLEWNAEVALSSGAYLLLSSDSNYIEFNIKGKYHLKDWHHAESGLTKAALKYREIATDSLLAHVGKSTSFSYLDEKKELLLDGKMALAPCPTKTYEREVTLKWKPYYDNTYEVEVFRSERQRYFYRLVNGTSITINFQEYGIPTDRCIYWTVRVNGSNFTSEPQCIYRMNISSASLVQLPLLKVKNQLKLENSALHNLMMALYCEERDLMIKADDYYSKAGKLALRNDAYLRLYENYLERRKLKTDISN